MAVHSCYVAVLLLAAGLVTRTDGFAIHVEAHEEECFFEQTTTGTKMGLNFQVAEGGFLDIDVTIKGPDGKIIYSGERETDGKYTFSAHVDGRYEYCFSNKMSSMTTKLVVFHLNVGTARSADNDEHDDKNQRLRDMVNELAESLHGVSMEQRDMAVRERTHYAINENTNSRVVYWSFFEALVLLAMSFGQVMYISRFFEVRTTV